MLNMTLDIINTIIAFIGLIIILVGLILPYKQAVKLSNIQQNQILLLEQKKWKKTLVDKQISNLYGPIYSIIVQNNIRFQRILYQLGRKHVIPRDKCFSDLSETDQAIWAHYVDTYKIKSQLEMAEIFKKNIHLVYNSQIPTCYKTFVDYSLGWELLDNQKRAGVMNFYEYHYVCNYPVEFDRYIKETLEHLMVEQKSLLDEGTSMVYMSVK